MVPPTVSLHADRPLNGPSEARAARRLTYAWYTYAFAAEVFAACAMAIFLPITLEQMAREIGFVAPDLIVPCTRVDETGVPVGDGVGVVCKAKILGSWVDTASFR
jgi:UMF1 family MFS transporter